MPRKSEQGVQGRRPAENPQRPRSDSRAEAARWRVGARVPHAAGDFPSHRRHGRNRRAITVVRSLTSLVALAALAPAAAAPASAQPIDLLGSPTVTAPPNNAAPSDTHAATALPLLGPSLTADEPRGAFSRRRDGRWRPGGSKRRGRPSSGQKRGSLTPLPRLCRPALQNARMPFSLSVKPGARSPHTIAKAPSERSTTHWRRRPSEPGNSGRRHPEWWRLHFARFLRSTAMAAGIPGAAQRNP